MHIKNKRARLVVVIVLFCFMFVAAIEAQSAEKKDIRDLSFHFNEPGKMGPWKFNSARGTSLSTTDWPGTLAIKLKEPYEELKGTLGKPITPSDYPLGWHYEQEVFFDNNTFQAMGETGLDAAVGLNVALTFSDPATWPADMSQQPPETHSLQLFLIHQTDPLSGGLRGKILVWTRGDLDPSGSVAGKWDIPMFRNGPVDPQLGAGRNIIAGGPFSQAMYLLFKLNGPDRVSVGIRFDQYTAVDWKHIKVSKYGKITGVWEIGPIIPSSSWFKETFPGAQQFTGATAFVGFCDFLYSHLGNIPPGDIEYYSKDFNIPGYIGLSAAEHQYVYYETWSNPGYLTVTLRPGHKGAGIGGGGDFRFSTFPPPWECEVCFIPPDDDCSWNLSQNFSVFSAMPGPQVGPTGDTAGDISSWCPGVANVPGKGHIAGNIGLGQRNVSGHLPPIPYGKPFNWDVKGGFGPRFPNGVPESILSHKPLFILCRVIDTKHLQMGVKANPEDEWFLTPVWESPREMAGFGQQSWTLSVYPGAKDYHQYLFKYLHWRNGISGPLENDSNRGIQSGSHAIK